MYKYLFAWGEQGTKSMWAVKWRSSTNFKFFSIIYFLKFNLKIIYSSEISIDLLARQKDILQMLWMNSFCYPHLKKIFNARNKFFTVKVSKVHLPSFSLSSVTIFRMHFLLHFLCKKKSHWIKTVLSTIKLWDF